MGFDLALQHGGQMTGGIKCECGDVSFGAGESSVALATRLVTLYAGSVNVIAGVLNMKRAIKKGKYDIAIDLRIRDRPVLKIKVW